MDNREIKNRYTEWAVNWTNNEEVRNAPELELFLESVLKYETEGLKSSERLGDYSIDYALLNEPENYIRKIAMRYIGHYRKMRW